MTAALFVTTYAEYEWSDMPENWLDGKAAALRLPCVERNLETLWDSCKTPSAAWRDTLGRAYIGP
jgi:hypothetical protein